MSALKGINRRDFLKVFPKFLAYSVGEITQEYFKPAGTEAPADETGGIDESSVSRIAHLEIRECIAWNGGSCQLCYLVCPLRDRAISITDQRPFIQASSCDGCAKCLSACQTVNDRNAITMALVSGK
jgi:Pyruvate/2-oxoacid:ferredoxin oxidoreductase delta subunit